jgi:hypothetical protein
MKTLGSMKTLEPGSAPDSQRSAERSALAAVGASPGSSREASLGALGDWVFAPRTRLAALAPRRPALPEEAGPRIARSGWPAVGEVEAELARLVRAAAPTRRVLCALAARALEIRSGSQLGFARIRDQARERHGISARSLQELARVHRVLAQAPAVDAAFQAGSLGWTALRSLARLERIEDPGLWIRRAKRLPLPELERAVRSARRAGEACRAAPPEPDEQEADTRVPVVCTRRVRAKWSLGRELARRVAGGRLPRWECAEIVAAEASSAAPPGTAARCDLDEAVDSGASLGDLVGRRRGPADDPEARGVEPAEPEAPRSAALPASPPELPPELACLLAGLHEAGAFEVDRRLRRALERERTHEARIGPLLRGVLEGRLYRRRGYWDRDRYLEERLGLCPRKARALVRIERVLARAPGLARAYRSGVLSWVQMQALAPLFEVGVGPGHARAWVDHAGSVSVRRLEDDVRGALAVADLDAERFARTGGLPDASGKGKEVEEMQRRERKTGARSDAGGRPERKIRARFAPDDSREDATIAFHAPAESARFFRAVLEEVRERLSRARSTPVSEGEAFEAMLDHAIQTWSERDTRVRRDHRIFERDGWRCAVPGCTSHRNLQAHHIVFRSRGGGDEPENLITLCAWHHQRGVHGGRVRISGRAPDRLRFELGLRDGEPPLIVYASGDRLVG